MVTAVLGELGQGGSSQTKVRSCSGTEKQASLKNGLAMLGVRHRADVMWHGEIGSLGHPYSSFLAFLLPLLLLFFPARLVSPLPPPTRLFPLSL